MRRTCLPEAPPNTVPPSLSVQARKPIDETRHESDERLVDALPSPDGTPVEENSRKAERDRVKGAMDTLPERDQTIVRMYYFEDLSFREIGSNLGITESRVSQLHSRIKQRLDEALAEKA